MAVNFGEVVVHSSVTRTLAIANTSSCPISLSPLMPQGPSASLFAVSIRGAGDPDAYRYSDPIPPQGTVTFQVSFSLTQPTVAATAPYSAYLTVNYAPAAFVDVQLSGIGVTNGLCVSTSPDVTDPPGILYNDVSPYSTVSGESIIIGNCANEPVTILAYLQDSASGAFYVGPCPPMANCQQILPDGGAYTLDPGDMLPHTRSSSRHRKPRTIGVISQSRMPSGTF